MLSFDFEDHVHKVLPTLADSHNPNFVKTSTVLGLTHKRVDPKHRSQVCTHWLAGLCQKGSECGYLHKLDKSKMPDCRHGKNCKIKNCPLKHTDEDAKPECMFFRQGFCFHGALCRYRHIKLSPDECPAVAKFEAFVDTLTGGAGGAGAAAPLGKKRKTQAPNAFYKITLCKHWLLNGVCPFGDECHFSHGEADLKQFSGTDDLDDSDIHDPVGNMASEVVIPWAENEVASYFLVHSPDLRSLVVSRRRNVWQLPVSVAAEVNTALQQQGENPKVILFFVVKGLLGLYGFAKVSAPIPPPAPMYPMSGEFPVEWLRTTRVSLKMVSQLKMPDGGSVARTGYDGLLVPAVGYEIMLVLLRKESWDWSVDLAAAESKKFDQERYMSAPLTTDVLFGQTWVDRCANMMMNIEELRAPNAGMGAVRAQEEYFYNGTLEGFIVGAPTAFFDEIFGRWILPLQSHLTALASDVIKPGAPLFLLDTNTEMLFGLFEAVHPLGSYEPTAFQGKCPDLQVPFRVVLDAPPVSGRDHEVTQLFNGRNASVDKLDLLTTKKLATLLAVRAGAMTATSTNLGGQVQLQDRVYSTGYKAPYEHVASVLVGIDFQGKDLLSIRRALLGPSAKNVLDVLNRIAPNAAKARLRGIGSGYGEGPEKIELQEPMQFTVCTQDPNKLEAVVKGMENLCKRVRDQFS